MPARLVARSFPKGSTAHQLCQAVIPCIDLYKRFGRLHNTRQSQNPHPRGPRLPKRPGASFGRRSGGQNIVDQQDIAVRHLPRVWNPECAPHIAPPSTGGQHRTLTFRGPGSLQCPNRNRFGGPPAQRARQLRGLVVAALPEPDGMQRHRNDQVAAVQKPRTGAFQPIRKTRHQVQPVGMFERQNRRAAIFVIGEDRAGTIIGRRASQAGRASRSCARIERKRQAAAIAHRAVQKRDSAPAARAKAMAPTQRLAARDAERWKQQIQQCGFQFRPHLL